MNNEELIKENLLLREENEKLNRRRCAVNFHKL